MKLKHALTYVPYNTRVITNDGRNVKLSLDIDDDDYMSITSLLNGLGKMQLRPLHSFNECIIHKGEVFKPKDILLTRYDYKLETFNLRTHNIQRKPFSIVYKLIEWHFDIFGLIEEGAAQIKKDKTN